MFDGYLKVVDSNGSELKVDWRDVLKMQLMGGISIGDIGGVPVATGSDDHVLLTTKSGKHKIPRSGPNDSEILTFMFMRGKLPGT